MTKIRITVTRGRGKGHRSFEQVDVPAGPIPEAGALPGMSAREAVDKFYSDRKHRTVEPSPQPPAPAAAPDVGEVLTRLNQWLDNDYVRRCPDYIKSRSLDHAIGGAFDALTAQAAALAAKEAEITTQRFAVASRNETLSKCYVRIAALEAALRKAEEALHLVDNWIRNETVAKALAETRAALAGTCPVEKDPT